jgi:hypothetical protein
MFMPKEELFFRQDVKQQNQTTCKYEKCFENNTFNSKSLYCTLHLKIMRDLTLEKFAQIAARASETQWNRMTEEIITNNYELPLLALSSLFKLCTGKGLSSKEKEQIWETFKSI